MIILYISPPLALHPMRSKYKKSYIMFVKFEVQMLQISLLFGIDLTIVQCDSLLQLIA